MAVVYPFNDHPMIVFMRLVGFGLVAVGIVANVVAFVF